MIRCGLTVSGGLGTMMVVNSSVWGDDKEGPLVENHEVVTQKTCFRFTQ